MNFSYEQLYQLVRRPALSNTVSDFWADAYISAHVLKTHLDPNTDAASRPINRVKAESAWIAAALDCGRLSNQPEILDLGCGPGLYARELADRGLFVHGIDFSPASIAYAQAKAASWRSKKPVATKPWGGLEFRLADFSRCSFPPNQAGAIMVYGIFGSLSLTERDRTLGRLKQSLQPGARFVFDTFTESYARQTALDQTWYSITKNGFWMAEAYTCLETSYVYEAQKTVLNCYYLISNKGLKVNYIRHRWYGAEELTELMESQGFRVLSIGGDLGGGSLDSDSQWLSLVTELGS